MFRDALDNTDQSSQFLIGGITSAHPRFPENPRAEWGAEEQ